MKKITLSLAALFSIAGTTNVLVQTDLDPVTVTASLTQAKISSTGRDITVIKGESFSQVRCIRSMSWLRKEPG